MNPLMILSAAEAQRDRHDAVAYARSHPEEFRRDRDKVHVVTFHSRAKAIALREFALNKGIFLGLARRGALYHTGEYMKTEIRRLRRQFDYWWRKTRIEDAMLDGEEG